MRPLIVAAVVFLILAGLVVASNAYAYTDCTRTTMDGEDRDCTLMEEYDECLYDAIDAADQRAERDDESTWLQFVEFNLDVAGCTVNLPNPFKLAA